HPDSVCHQWSITGLLVTSTNQWSVSSSKRSPAENTDSNCDKSYCRHKSPSGSAARIARYAVGAEKVTFDLSSQATCKNDPPSVPPTCLPSYTTVVAPPISGAYTM